MNTSFQNGARRRLLSLAACLVLIFGLPLIGSAEPYGVRYTVEGYLLNQKKNVTLNTEDGRMFILLMDPCEAKKFEEHRVRVEGMAHRSDELDAIKVKSITECPAPEKEEPPVAHADYQRPPTIVKTTPDAFVIKDVRWDICQDTATSTKKAKHTWETATIKPELVDGVYMAIKPFAPKFIAAHSLWVFTFKSGGMVSATGKESQALALSIEAFKKVGQSYGLIKCLKKNFEIVYNLVTWANYATLNVKFNSSTDTNLILYPVLLTHEQKVKLLRATIVQATVNRQGEFYHTTRNNCTNNLVILLNQVLPPEKRLKLWTIPSVLYSVKATMPLSLVKMLTKKGFLGKPLPNIDLAHFTTVIGSTK